MMRTRSMWRRWTVGGGLAGGLCLQGCPLDPTTAEFLAASSVNDFLTSAATVWFDALIAAFLGF